MFWLYQGRSIVLAGLWNAFFWPAAGTLVAVAVCEAIRHGWHIGPGTVPFAAGYGIAFTAVYLLFLRLASARLMGELVNYIPGAGHFRKLFLLGAAA